MNYRLTFSRYLLPFVAVSAMVAILLPLATRAGAQSPPTAATFLHSFTGGTVGDGADPDAPLIQGTDGNFYGTTETGGNTLPGIQPQPGLGTIFKMTPSGQVTILHIFGDGTILNDGVAPLDGLVEGKDGNFYGTTELGGSTASSSTLGDGTVFRITPAGQMTILHSFGDGSVPSDGLNPIGGLILGTDGNFYGTTVNGGTTFDRGNGTVFKMTQAGQVTILHIFSDGSVPNDGDHPEGSLVQGTDGNFYGTTATGGSTINLTNSLGTVFKITPSGQETVLHSFGDGSVPNDGTEPEGTLIQGPDGNFYGTTSQGGSSLQNGLATGFGCVFKITTSGQVTILHGFGTVPNDGEEPNGSLVEGPDGNFYGTTSGGGEGQEPFGTVFKITPTGQETILLNFEQDSTIQHDGFGPQAGVILGSNNDLYGTTVFGGTAELGTVFDFIPAPTNLVAIAGDAQVSLNWTAVANATTYNVYRGTTSGKEMLYQSGISGTFFTDIGASNSTTYYYEVTTVNSGGESGPSNEASATPEPPIPPAPTNLVATAGNAQVSLSWTGSAGAASYNVYKSTTSGAEVLYRSNIATTSFVDPGVNNGTTYFYEVTAVNGGGESGKSNQASATPQIPLAPAPTNLAATGDNSQVSLSWSASAGAASYNVYKGMASGSETLIKSGLTTTSYTDLSVTNNTTYFYEVTAVNAAGESGTSNEASATPFASVTFPAGLQMFSVPYSYPGVGLDTLFGYANVTLAVWSQPLAQYAITPTPPADAITLGQGYWARFPHQVTTTVGGTPAPTNQPFEIALTAGWNMVGDPFLSSVPVANLTFNGGTETFAQATTGGNPLIGGIVYGYSQATNDYFSTPSLVPQQGYWVFAFSNTDMEVPPP